MYNIFSNTLFYFTLLTIKYFFYSEIILGFLKNYDFLLNLNSNYLSILFISLFLGISHFLFIEYFFKNFVTSFFQINLMKIFLVPSLLYGVKLFNISRILLASGIILWIIFDIIFNIKPTINYLMTPEVLNDPAGKTNLYDNLFNTEGTIFKPLLEIDENNVGRTYLSFEENREDTLENNFYSLFNSKR